MTVDIAAQTLRELDGAGTLKSRGFFWTQPRERRYRTVMTVIGLLRLAGWGFVIWGALALLAGRVPLGVGLGVLGAALFGLNWLGRRETVHRQLLYFRAVRFQRTGEIELNPPLRFWEPAKGEEITDWWTCRLALNEISSIQLQPAQTIVGGPALVNLIGVPYRAFNVTLFFHTGETMVVGWDLPEEPARIINIQLNNALREVRALAANG